MGSTNDMEQLAFNKAIGYLKNAAGLKDLPSKFCM